MHVVWVENVYGASSLHLMDMIKNKITVLIKIMFPFKMLRIRKTESDITTTPAIRVVELQTRFATLLPKW